MKIIWLRICVITAVAPLCVTHAKPDEPSKTQVRAADPMRGKEAGQLRDDNGLKMQFVWCPPGKFTMGSPRTEVKHIENEAQVDVTLTRGFWLGEYEVTQDEYERLMWKNPSSFSAKGQEKKQVVGMETQRFPVESVTLDDAMEFCRKLTEQERHAGRLVNEWEYTVPTEAQWEYACRAGTATAFSFGTTLNSQ